MVVLCRPHFILSHSKGLWPCGVCITLYTMLHVLLRCSVLLRRGIHLLMIQVPHWTPLSYTVAILGNKCGILRSCPLLPSRRPLFLLLVWLWLCSLVFGAFLLFIQSPLPSLRREKSGAQMREFLRLVCLRCWWMLFEWQRKKQRSLR